MVAAAGNSASSSPFYPAYYTNAIAVAATTDLDKLASFSDYGDWVDVSAPGISIYSTVPGGYQYMSGTSMAAPFVSGLAALLFAEGLSNDQVRAQIQNTADNIGVAGIGSGRIDAYRAVTPDGAALATGERDATGDHRQRGCRQHTAGVDRIVGGQPDELCLPVAAVRFQRRQLRRDRRCDAVQLPAVLY